MPGKHIRADEIPKLGAFCAQDGMSVPAPHHCAAADEMDAVSYLQHGIHVVGIYHRSYVGIRTLLPTLIKGSTASPKYMDTIENIKINTEDIT